MQLIFKMFCIGVYVFKVSGLELAKIAEYIIESFLHIWPYLLITIPLAVGVQITGAALP